MRQIVLDTETTGIDPSEGHKIIEIGCVEMVDRKLTGRHYHQYINPEREVDAGAFSVHGISDQFLLDKPVFKDIFEVFIQFIKGAELVIHNAPFDIGFLDAEIRGMDLSATIEKNYVKGVVDSLLLARKKHPGQKNSLDALCKRYGIDNSKRDLHGALLDAEILADVYLVMTGGQTALQWDEQEKGSLGQNEIIRLDESRSPLKVLRASTDELKRHEQRLNDISVKSENIIWRMT